MKLFSFVLIQFYFQYQTENSANRKTNWFGVFPSGIAKIHVVGFEETLIFKENIKDIHSLRFYKTFENSVKESDCTLYF